MARKATRIKLENQIVTLGLAKSRTFARQLIKDSRITLNGQVIRARDTLVAAKDAIALLAEPSTAPDAPKKVRTAKPKVQSVGRAGVDWQAAGRKAWETRQRNMAAKAATAPQASL